jgi:hypothetical protein
VAFSVRTERKRRSFPFRAQFTHHTKLINKSFFTSRETFGVTSCYFIVGHAVKLKLSRYRHAGDKGERKYSSYSFLTSALDGSEWSASLPGRALPPVKDPRYLLYRRLGGPQSWYGHSG